MITEKTDRPKSDESVNKKNKKSALISLKPGEILFHEGDKAESLYIIQKGQLRLFRPKGKGFIELALLRSGEVLGEMAYFASDDPGESGRSCSAQAIVKSEVIEISFKAFAKTLNDLNPWFQTIINTLASRLRKSNAKIKELESNSVAQGYTSGGPEYQFLRTNEIIKILSTLFVVGKSLGKEEKGGITLQKNVMNFYALDIYNIFEAKLVEFFSILKEMELLQMVEDVNGTPNIYLFTNIAEIKNLLIFFSTQRTLRDDKKIKISPKCQMFLEMIMKQLEEEIAKSETKTKPEHVNISQILNAFQERGIQMMVEDLAEAKSSGMVGDVIVGNNNTMICKYDYDRICKNYIPIKMMNIINRVNDNMMKTKK